MEKLKKKILILDDERLVLKCCERILARENWEVPENEFDAMKAMREEDYDLALIDLMMPRMSGMEFLRLARECRPRLRALIMTGLPQQSSEKEALRLGVVDIGKTIGSVMELESKVESALNEKDQNLD